MARTNYNRASASRNLKQNRSLRSRTNRLRRSRLRGRRLGRGGAIRGAQGALRQFRQASILAVAITGFLILLIGPADPAIVSAQEDTTVQVQEEVPDTVYIIEEKPVEELIQNVEPELEEEVVVSGEELGEATVNEALKTFENLWDSFFSNLPKIFVAIITLVLAWLLVKLVRFILHKTIGRYEGTGGIIAVSAIIIWLFAIGVAVSVVAGDIRALIGSLGLVGLALSWSLQTPIESFTGWLLNSFKHYYKIGDRIQVGDIFGDVYKIDFLTTTVWEIGGPFRQGFVMAEQPTGRLVTFPNNEILSGSIVNLTRDFPYVWDELNTPVANESDLRLAMEVIKKTAKEVLGEYMKEPAQQYENILERAGLTTGTSENPQVYIAATDSWMEIVVRYLVGAAERRKWKSELTIAIAEELAKSEYKKRIIPVYTRQQIQVIDDVGLPVATVEGKKL